MFTRNTPAQKLDSWIMASCLLSYALMWTMRIAYKVLRNVSAASINIPAALCTTELLALFFTAGMLAFYCVLFHELSAEIRWNAAYILLALALLAVPLVSTGLSVWIVFRKIRSNAEPLQAFVYHPEKTNKRLMRFWRYVCMHPYVSTLPLLLLSALCFSASFTPVFERSLPYYHIIRPLLSGTGSLSTIVSADGYIPYAPPNSLLGLELVYTILDTPASISCALAGDLTLVATDCYDLSVCVSSESLREIAKKGADLNTNSRFSGPLHTNDILALTGSQVSNLNIGSKYVELDPFDRVRAVSAFQQNENVDELDSDSPQSYVTVLQNQNMTLLTDALFTSLSTSNYAFIHLKDRPNIVYNPEHLPTDDQHEDTEPLPYSYVLGSRFVNLIHQINSLTDFQLNSYGIIVDTPATLHPIMKHLESHHSHIGAIIPSTFMDNKASLLRWYSVFEHVDAINGIYCTFHSVAYCMRAPLLFPGKPLLEVHFLHANSLFMLAAATLINAQYVHTNIFASYGYNTQFVIDSILLSNARILLILYIVAYVILFLLASVAMVYAEIRTKKYFVNSSRQSS